MKAAAQAGVTMVAAKAMSSPIGKGLRFTKHQARTMEARSRRHLCKILNIWFEREVAGAKGVKDLGGKGVNLAKHDVFKEQADLRYAQSLHDEIPEGSKTFVQKVSEKAQTSQEERGGFEPSSLEGVCAGTSFDWNISFLEGSRVGGVDQEQLLQGMAQAKSDGVTAEAAGIQMLYESMKYKAPKSDQFFVRCLHDMLKLSRADDKQNRGVDNEVKFKEVIQAFVEGFVREDASLGVAIRDEVDFAPSITSSESGADITLMKLLKEVIGEGKQPTVENIRSKLGEKFSKLEEDMKKEKPILGNRISELRKTIKDELTLLLEREDLESKDNLQKLIGQAGSLSNSPKTDDLNSDMLNQLGIDEGIKATINRSFEEMVEIGARYATIRKELGRITEHKSPLDDQINQLLSLVEMRDKIADKGWEAIEKHSDVYDAISTDIKRKLIQVEDYHEFFDKLKVIADLRGIQLEECDEIIGPPGSYKDDDFRNNFSQLKQGSYVFDFDYQDPLSGEVGGHACSYINLGDGRHCFTDPNHPPYIYNGDAKDGLEILMAFYARPETETRDYNFRIIKMSSSVPIHKLPMSERADLLIKGFESDLNKLKRDTRSSDEEMKKRAEGRIVDIKDTLRGTKIFGDLEPQVQSRLNIILAEWQDFLDVINSWT